MLGKTLPNVLDGLWLDRGLEFTTTSRTPLCQTPFASLGATFFFPAQRFFKGFWLTWCLFGYKVGPKTSYKEGYISITISIYRQGL